MWLKHTVTVEAYEGDAAYGPRYALPVAVRCFLEQKTRTVRDKTGQEVVSSGTFYARLDEAQAICPAESRITLPDGSTTLVIAALPRDGGGLPTPDHLEVQLI
ncbi:hypothetical protein HRW18_05435 [Streptomyces lunaelactis]|nr:hypothetical protein [Streptomyces lunaelactis]